MRRVSGYILDPLLDKLENGISFANIGQYHCRVLNFNFSYSIELISTQKTWFHFSHKNIKSHLTHPHFWPQFCMFHMNTVLSFKRIKYICSMIKVCKFNLQVTWTCSHFKYIYCISNIMKQLCQHIGYSYIHKMHMTTSVGIPSKYLHSNH